MHKGARVEHLGAAAILKAPAQSSAIIPGTTYPTSTNPPYSTPTPMPILLAIVPSQACLPENQNPINRIIEHGIGKEERWQLQSLPGVQV